MNTDTAHQRGFCEDCRLPKTHHIQTWIDGWLDAGSMRWALSILPALPSLIDRSLCWIFIGTGLGKWSSDIRAADIPLRSALLMEAARNRGWDFQGLRGPWGWTGTFRLRRDQRVVVFDGLPSAEDANHDMDDKDRTRARLRRIACPIAEGKTFSFLQKNNALHYGIDRLKYPLVIKPRSGSVGRHVTTNIVDAETLRRAIDHACAYSPFFIVEQHIDQASVFRATVVDGKMVACVQQVPANVVGDGQRTIRELVSEKNECRRTSGQYHPHLYHELVVNREVERVLRSQGFGLVDIPPTNTTVRLQDRPLMATGADLIDVTDGVHEDNRLLFEQVAKDFSAQLTGIDFIAPHIDRSWKHQRCAILELNSLPSIEMHMYPATGQPRDVAQNILDMIESHS